MLKNIIIIYELMAGNMKAPSWLTSFVGYDSYVRRLKNNFFKDLMLIKIVVGVPRNYKINY